MCNSLDTAASDATDGFLWCREVSAVFRQCRCADVHVMSCHTRSAAPALKLCLFCIPSESGRHRLHRLSIGGRGPCETRMIVVVVLTLISLERSRLEAKA